MIQNPFRNNSPIQTLLWTQMEKNQKYHFEIIQPLRGMARPWRGEKGAYLTVCAECLEPIFKGDWLWVQKGTLCKFGLPIATLETAWCSLSPKFRQTITEPDNVRMRFLKKSKQCIVFEDIERKSPTEEHKRFADEVYSQNQLSQYEIKGMEEY